MTAPLLSDAGRDSSARRERLWRGAQRQTASASPGIPTGLALAKLIEKRRRSRIERARQLSSNIEVQAHIRRATDLYNLEAQKLQLKNALGGMGANIPQAMRTIHEARLAQMESGVSELQRQQEQTPMLALATREMTGFRRLRRTDQPTLDQYAR